MSYKKLSYLAGAVTVMLLALSVVLWQQAAAVAQEPVERPFRMQTVGVVLSEEPSADCPVLQTVVESSGTATHMGAVTLTRTHCFSPTGDPPISDGYWEAFAANGDRIWGSYQASLVPTQFDDQGQPIVGLITAPYTVEGGIGRFEGATGEGTTSGEFDLVNGIGDFVSEGWIRY
jgi:hypothetical protein